MHLEVYLHDAENPAESELRVWDAPAQQWILQNATEELVLEALADAAVERAVSSGRKAIARARSEKRVLPPGIEED